MGLNPGTLLKRLEGIVTGFGFKRVIPGIGIESLRTSAGLILEAATTPKRAAFEAHFEGVAATAGSAAGGTLNFVVPRDYDETNDYLAIRILAQSAGTDVPTIDATVYRKREGYAIVEVDPTISGAINTATALADWVEIVFDGKGLKAGDAMNVELIVGTHASHDANFYGLEIVYRSDLVYYENTER